MGHTARQGAAPTLLPRVNPIWQRFAAQAPRSGNGGELGRGVRVREAPLPPGVLGETRNETVTIAPGWSSDTLITHELAHVVQQRRGAAGAAPAGRSALEAEARTAALASRTSAPDMVRGAAAPGLVQYSRLSEEIDALRVAGRPKGEVFDKLRRNGAAPADADALSSIHALYPAGTDDRWLAETLLTYGAETMWPAALIERRAQLAAGHHWAPEPGNIRSELAYPAEVGSSPPPPVVAHFFPGRTGQRALILGGIHGNEPQGARVVESLRGELTRMCTAGTPPYFSTILVPILHRRTHDTGTRHIPRRAGESREQTERSGIEPNRTFPAAGEDYRQARERVARGAPELVYTPPAGTTGPPATGHEATEMIPETRVLIALIERFRPQRIASVHAHSIGPTAAGRRGNDPGVFVDPALRRDRAPDPAGRAVGERMLAEGRRRTGALPEPLRTGRNDPFLGNVGGEVLYDPNAPHPRGYSLGDWAPAPTPTREGITTVTVEVPQYQGRVSGPEAQRVEDLHRDLLRDIFLGPPSAAP